jgi:hypothetical protein
MKQVKLIACIVLCISILSCSKKDTVISGTPHIIRVTVSGTQDFAITVATARDVSVSPVVKVSAKAVVNGTTYNYSEQLYQTGQISLTIQSDVTNSISYTIYDNEKIVMQETNVEVDTHASFLTEYQVL